MMTASVAKLVEHYRSILVERMHGLPFVNASLEVAAVDFRDIGTHSVGVLISPWFMNLVLLPGTDEWSQYEQGAIRRIGLPGETIDFNVCHDDALGTYLTASLFRSVADFPNQETAIRIAEQTMQRLFSSTRPARANDVPQVSRRQFLTRLGADS